MKAPQTEHELSLFYFDCHALRIGTTYEDQYNFNVILLIHDTRIYSWEPCSNDHDTSIYSWEPCSDHDTSTYSWESYIDDDTRIYSWGPCIDHNRSLYSRQPQELS